MEAQRILIGTEEFSVAVGSGEPTVLFLHGLAGHGGEWDHVIARLRTDIGFLIPDLRAHGQTWEFGTTAVGKQKFVHDAVSLIERFANGPVTVVGQSMGGIVATHLAHARPDLVEHLFLVDAGMGSITESDLADLRTWFGRWPEVFTDEREANEFFGVSERSTPAWVQGLARTNGGLKPRFDVDSMINTMRALAAEDRWSAWSEIEIPVTLVRGENGTIDDVEIARMMEIQPDSELVVIKDSGHDVHLDQPELVAELLDRLLSER